MTRPGKEPQHTDKKIETEQRQPHLVNHAGKLGVGKSSSVSNHATATRSVCVGTYFRRKSAVKRGRCVIYEWPCIGCPDCGFRGHPICEANVDYEAAPRATQQAPRRATRPASPDESAAPPRPVPLWNPITGSWWDPILIEITKNLPF